jgi:hypothetical protein
MAMESREELLQDLHDAYKLVSNLENRLEQRAELYPAHGNRWGYRVMRQASAQVYEAWTAIRVLEDEDVAKLREREMNNVQD